MNKQELVNKLNAISERFSAEIKDTQLKKDRLSLYSSSQCNMELDISNVKQEISEELDLDKLKALKTKLKEKEQEHSEMLTLIANLTNYTSDKSCTERLDVIRKEYKETEKDLYECIMGDCSQQIDDLVKKHPELLSLIRDFVVASALVRNAIPTYHYGAPFLHLYGYFMDKEWREHSGILRQNLGVAELQSW